MAFFKKFDDSDFQKELKERRTAFARVLKQQNALPCLLLMDAAPEQMMCPDNEYRYRQDSDFYYLTGLNEPKACMAMLIHLDYDFPEEDPVINYRLFLRPRDYSKEIWTGQRVGLEGAREEYGADSAYLIEVPENVNYHPELKRLILSYVDQRIYFASRDPESPASKLIKQLKGVILFPGDGAFNENDEEIHYNLFNPLKPLHEFRAVKTPYEIELMRRTCEISGEAHQELMRRGHIGMREHQLDGLFTGYVMQKGCPRLAYPNIAASGANATILHYMANNREIGDNDLVLVDAGGEFMGYAADITRTWPINGKFSEAQREIYELVLKVQKECIEMVRPGVTMQDLDHRSLRLMGRGLMKLGIITNKNMDTVRQFYMHRLGHWLGMDVHDCLEYPTGPEAVLKPGMVLTVEPGLYFNPMLEPDVYTNQEVFKKYRGIGVRIEDDILVTPDGYEVLSAGCPKEVEEIENLVGRAYLK